METLETLRKRFGSRNDIPAWGARVGLVVVLAGVLVLVALFGTRQPHRWAFYVLAGLDTVLVAVLGLLWLGYGLRDPGTNLFGGLIVGAFALKAALTVAAARKL